MSQTWKILIGVLFALVVLQGAGLLYLWNSGSAGQAAKPAETAARADAPPAARAFSPLAAQSSQSSQSPPPSVQTSLPTVQLPPGIQSMPSGVGAPRPDPRRAERVRRLQRKLRELTANGRRPAPMEIDPILQELTEIQGSTTVGGMDIQVLRDNLKVADRMQKLARELQEEAQKPQRDAEKIKALQEAILQEQRALRLDFMAGGAAAPAPAKE